MSWLRFDITFTTVIRRSLDITSYTWREAVSLARIGSYILWPVRRVKNINFFVSKCKSIKYVTKMARNYTSNNIDFVQPTKYPISKNCVAKKPPPVPEPLPAFEPLPIYGLI